MIAFVVLAFILFVLVEPAAAYVDPGSGSMVVQLLLGGAVAMIVGLRSLWRRLTRPLRRVTPSREQRPAA